MVKLGRCRRRDATLSRGNVPGIEGFNMNALWTFEGGRLVARNQTGAVLWAWVADEAMGRPLADLLNHSQDLSRLLLPPWTGAQGAQPGIACHPSLHLSQDYSDLERISIQ